MKGKSIDREFMEEAIEKASSLIQILTNENEQLKIENIKMQEIINTLEKTNSEAINANIGLTEDKDEYTTKIRQYENKVNAMKEYVEKL